MTYGPGTGWVVFAEPEGDQCCILRSLAEVAEVEDTAGIAD